MSRLAFALAVLLCLSGCSHYVREHKYHLHGVEEANSTKSQNTIACGHSAILIPSYLYSRMIFGGFIVPFIPMQHIKRQPYKINAPGMSSCPTLVQAEKQVEAERRGSICLYDNRKVEVTKDFFIKGSAGCQSDVIRYEKRIERDYCFTCIQ